ncbi:DnaA/Hda family protein [Paenibacillus sp. FSL M8-0228]|uniref:DnaA ATPase domain-containing protein n=1 Tax=Paenibacillus sp. FSL M8-0228 TaxID=2921620 RepID=UPI0030FB4CDC
MPREVATVEPCSCLLDRQLTKYTANSSFNHEQKQHTFKNADIDAKNAQHFAMVTKFVDNIEAHQEKGTWLYIFGDETRIKGSQSAYGTGKTYLMDCIANALAERHIPGLYVTEETLFGDIRSTYSRNSEESETEVLSRYYNVPVLMIDDLFTASYSEWAEGKLYSILNERMDKNKITIITSNYATERIHQRLPLNGRKIASRIIGQAQRIEMIGPDRREKKARDRFQLETGNES